MACRRPQKRRRHANGPRTETVANKIVWPPGKYPNKGRAITQSVRTKGILAGTQIFYNNGYDECVRPYPGGKKPRPPPSGNGLWPSTLTAQWQTMTQAEQDRWKTRAKNAQLPTYQTFMQYNERRHARGLPPVTEAP